MWVLLKQKTRAESRKSFWRTKLPMNDAGSANETANETAKVVESDTDVINAKINGRHVIETANARNEMRIDNILKSVFQTAW